MEKTRKLIQEVQCPTNWSSSQKGQKKMVKKKLLRKKKPRLQECFTERKAHQAKQWGETSQTKAYLGEIARPQRWKILKERKLK